ncbi:MAG: phosphotransferase [Ilumatobacter sp.]|uniref:phosphotransferase family protein n=1 Tax=Ilumatobacter sp. TaxID=1967498 RepID=UPI0026188F40|nr:phosphotransferase [Ilumatobacter sp.]MDJ0769615.1 phosphotransferase [Ilumatobacter sp.]
MTAMGPLVAAGRTSDVYAYGAFAVVKVPRPEVPSHWAPMEAKFTAAVRQLGVPAPDVLDVVQVDDRPAIVFERIDGRSMWEHMLERPGDIPALSNLMAEVHRHILTAGLPTGVAGLVDRMCKKIAEVQHLPDTERQTAHASVTAMPRGAALLHGDLHPGNVLMSANGPVVIDWFDATIGHPVADVVRTSLLVRPYGLPDAPPHLPGADPDLLDRLHSSYVAAMIDVLEVPVDVLRAWEAVVAVSRLAESAQTDDAALLTLWTERQAESTTALLDARSAALAE